MFLLKIVQGNNERSKCINFERDEEDIRIINEGTKINGNTGNLKIYKYFSWHIQQKPYISSLYQFWFCARKSWKNLGTDIIFI